MSVVQVVALSITIGIIFWIFGLYIKIEIGSKKDFISFTLGEKESEK